MTNYGICIIRWVQCTGVWGQRSEMYSLAVQEFLSAGATQPTNPDILTIASREPELAPVSMARPMRRTGGEYRASNPRLHAYLGYMYYAKQPYDRPPKNSPCS
jgi:hypothetical protein